MRTLHVVCLAAIATLVSSCLLAQNVPPSSLQVIHQSWTFRDGSPQAILALAQTSDGFLWLGSESGLVRFDGVRFEPFKSPFGDQLLSNSVYSLFAPETGGLWVGYQLGGFSYIEHGRVRNFAAGGMTGTVNQFAQGRDGVIWAATNTGLWTFDGTEWHRLGSDWNAPPVAGRVGFDKQDTFWVLSKNQQLFALRSGGHRFELAMEDVTSDNFTSDADGRVITAPSEPTKAPRPVFGRPSLGQLDRANSLWIVTQQQLFRVPPSSLDIESRLNANTREKYPVVVYQSTAKVVDRDGDVWFGTLDGLHRFSYSQLTRLRSYEPMNGLVPSARGDLFVIAYNNSILRIRDGHVQTKTRLPGKCKNMFAGCQIGVSYSAPDGTVWFGGESGLWSISGNNLIEVPLPANLRDQPRFLQALAQDKQGRMWVSFGRHGLYRWNKGTWEPQGNLKGLPDSGVVVEFADPGGRVWFGYADNKVTVVDADRVQVFDEHNGLHLGKVTAIYAKRNTTWIGGDSGLQRVEGHHIESVAAFNPDLLRGISGIVETAGGDLWVNGLSGIVHFKSSEIAKSLKNPSFQVKGERLSRRQGLPGFAPQLRPLPTALESNDGKLWFTSINAAVSIDPSTYMDRRISPARVSIQSISANDVNYPPGQTLRFPAHTLTVEINYSAVSLSDPEAIRTRYKLDETDSAWREISGVSPVTYRNVPPGHYHFKVNASDNNGVWSGEIAEIEFNILPAFYQTNWFVALCIGAAAAVIWMLYLLRLRQLRAQFNVALEERVSERTRIARELHDTLLQNLHGVLFQFQAAKNLLHRDPQRAEQTMESALAGTEETITQSQQAIEELRSPEITECDFVQLLSRLGNELTVAHSDGQKPPAFHVIVEGVRRDLSPVIQDQVYSIAREIIRNSCHHANASEIEAEVRYDVHEFRLRIRDNGKGISKEVLELGKREGHWGLPGIHERAERIGAKIVVWSELGAGTETQLTIPASLAYRKSPARRRFRIRNKD